MPDVLIPDVPAEDFDGLDELARRVGLSRTEFLRRLVHREARRVQCPVKLADLEALAARLSDLAEADVMRDARS